MVVTTDLLILYGLCTEWLKYVYLIDGRQNTKMKKTHKHDKRPNQKIYIRRDGKSIELKQDKLKWRPIVTNSSHKNSPNNKRSKRINVSMNEYLNVQINIYSLKA